MKKKRRIDQGVEQDANPATDRKNGYAGPWRLAVRGMIAAALLGGAAEVAKYYMYHSAEYRAPAWPAAGLRTSYGEKDCEATLTIRFQQGELDGKAVLEQLLSVLGLKESSTHFEDPLPLDPTIVSTFKHSMKIMERGGRNGKVVLVDEPSVDVSPFFSNAPASNPHRLMTIKLHVENEEK